MFSKLNTIGLITVGTILSLGTGSTALAQSVPNIPSSGFQLPNDVIAALSYPSSSQRFFEEGKAQFEREVQQLSDEPITPQLTVQPEVLEQFEEQSD